MDDLNQVAIAGRLTRDPQLRTTRNGTTICNVRIACNKMFFNVKVWGDAGRDLAASTSRGDIIQVEGRLDWYEWSPGDGPRREFVGVVASDTPGSVKCIASAPKPALVMAGDGAVAMGMGQVAEANATQELASAIAAQSATVDLGFTANSSPDAGNVAAMAPTPQTPGVVDPVSGGLSLPQAPGSVSPITPSPQFQAPGELATAPFASTGQAVAPFASAEQQPPAFTGAPAPAFVQGVDAVPLPAESDLAANSSAFGGTPAVRDSTVQQITEPAFASPTAAFVAPAMPASLAGTEVPDGLAAYQAMPAAQDSADAGVSGVQADEIVHDENAALAADPEHEVIAEDSRFI
jgi:single-stranded DNA-binding protein